MAQGYLAGPPASRMLGAHPHRRRPMRMAEHQVCDARRRARRVRVPDPIRRRRTHARTLAGRRVEKIRHHVPAGPHVFEIDEFLGDNAGLIVAEIELARADESFERPEWLGREVSDLARYYNLNLATHPYSQWTAAERGRTTRSLQSDVGVCGRDRLRFPESTLRDEC